VSLRKHKIEEGDKLLTHISPSGRIEGHGDVEEHDREISALYSLRPRECEENVHCVWKK